jgi:urocanate hydratase
LDQRSYRRYWWISKRVALAKANKEIVSIAYLGNVVDWEKFDEKIFISIWEATRPPYIIRTQEDIIQLTFLWGCECDDGRKPYYSKVQETLRRHTTAINKQQQKEPISLIMEMRSLLEASRAGADIMADNHIDFKYWVTYRISWGPCVLIMVWSFRWVCASGKPGFRPLWQNSTIEIQQQMQDNIQWIKAQKIN